MSNQVIAGVHARTVVSEMEASGEVFRGIKLDAAVAVSGGSPNTTATGNVYIQEVEGINSTNGLPQFSFASGFSNTNATKKAALFRTANPTTSVIEVKFDDYNYPASEPIYVIMQPGDHYLFVSMRPNGGAHQASWRVKDSGAAFVNAGSSKAANSNVFNWDGTTSLPSSLVSPSQQTAGADVKVSFDKNLTKQITKVSQDAIFSDESNWRLVSFIFKKTGSSQRIVSSFRNFDAEKSIKLKSGMVSGDGFQLHKIIISKADRTLLVIKRDEISSAESFDFILK